VFEGQLILGILVYDNTMMQMLNFAFGPQTQMVEYTLLQDIMENLQVFQDLPMALLLIIIT
jgi:hypothetical protein